MMDTRRWIRAVAVGGVVASLVLTSALGCRSKPKATDLPKELLAQRWVEPGVPPDTNIELDRAMVEGLALALAKQGPPAPHKQGRPLELLALSAGGKFGAYTVGVLAGWEASGSRPRQFDVVTGVSSGAVIALFAYLGPQHDPTLKQFFTESSSQQLFDKRRPVRNILRYGSLATAEPLKRIIASEVNRCVLDEVRTAHLAGRRLYIATLNYQAKRVVVWDIGAIACSGREDADDLIRKILLAACSIPGMVPPVEFDVCVDGRHYKEKHSDGGAVTQTFMELGNHQALNQPGTRWLEGSNMYVIAAGKFYADPADGNINLLGRIGASVSASLYSLYRAELCKLYALCLVTGLGYNIVALDPSMETDSKSMNIVPEDMKKLFDSGYQQACRGVPWRKVPPGGLTGEEEVPRSGTCFITLPKP